MATYDLYKKIFSKTNLYFAGTLLVLAVATIVLLYLLKGQSAKTLQAQLISQTGKTFQEQYATTQNEIQDLTKVYSQLPADLKSKYGTPIKTTTLVKMFDNIEAQYNSPVNPFFISGITFNDQGTVTEGELAKITADMSIETSQENLIKFLRYIELSGMSEARNDYLMEVESISFSVSDSEIPSESITLTITLNIYYAGATS